MLLTIARFMRPAMADTMGGEILEMTGIALIIAGVLGRLWSILYVGGRKNAEVVTSGPYSMCRHPLYLFSTMATLGFGLMLQSLVFAALLTGAVFVILSRTASKEDRKLRALFPDGAYDRYADSTPRIIPNPALFRTEQKVTFDVSHLRTNLFDGLVFLSLIPVAEILEWLHEAVIPHLFTLP